MFKLGSLLAGKLALFQAVLITAVIFEGKPVYLLLTNNVDTVFWPGIALVICSLHKIFPKVKIQYLLVITNVDTIF